MMKKIQLILLGIFLLNFSCSKKSENNIIYPTTEKQDVVDTYFDTEVADPYRWLENDTTQAVAKWVKEQNEVTEEYLSKIPFRNKLKQRLTDIVNYEKIGIPFKKHGKYYFYKNDGLQNQNVLYVKETIDGEASVLLDPNMLSDNGTVALSGISFSNDGKYLAYIISRSGSDWREIFVIDLETKQLATDHIKWAKFTSASWFGDGFFYSAYAAPDKGKEFSNVNENHKIYFHKIGTDQSADKVAYQNTKYPKRFYSASVDDDEKFLFISESGVGRGNRLFVQNLQKNNTPVVEIASDYEYTYSPLEVIGNTVYFYTNYKAPKYRLAKTDINSLKLETWKDVVPETENVLNNITFVDDKMLLVYDKDASSHAYVYSLEGELKHKVELPTIGSVGFSGNKNDKEIFYSFSSFTFPNTIYKYDIDNNTSEIYLAPKIDFDFTDFITEQVFYSSKDGTKIPMFLTFKKGLKNDGTNPVYLYGYGGFNASLKPSFSTMRIPFMEKGGIYAVANLRGGGEYGEEWHLAGTKMQKQNVFDDFIAAAEYLIENKYTNSNKLAIAGGSNGGLLVGACVNQRPDLFRVALPLVGVMDMLRYHLFTIGWNWARDYGRSDDNKEMFEYLYAYSPIHNIKNDGTPYPAILITTADHDDRVVPAHSFKYAATLQAANTGKQPKLIRIETEAGHGAGKPISKTLQEQADLYSFVMYNLGMKFE